MTPSNEMIKEFQRRYSEEFGEEISKEEAYEKFLRLVNFLRVILRFSPKQDPDKANSGPADLT